MDINQLHERLERQEKLIQLLKDQLTELTLLSKIELGDDVIQEIRRLEHPDTTPELIYRGSTHEWRFTTYAGGAEHRGTATVFIDFNGWSTESRIQFDSPLSEWTPSAEDTVREALQEHIERLKTNG